MAEAGFWCWVGHRFTRDELRASIEEPGASLAVTPVDVAWAVGWFERHGRPGVLFGRLLPWV